MNLIILQTRSEGNDSADEWDLNVAPPSFEDPTKISYHDYKYCIYDSENVAEVSKRDRR
jgi:hypothetical protein